MFRIIAPPLAGTFIVVGGTTEISIGLVLVGSAGVGTREAGPQTTADCLAKVNSTSISYAPMFLNGRRYFWAAEPLYGPFLTTTDTTRWLL